MKPVMRLATRGSVLALAQTTLVAAALRGAGVAHLETMVITTTGDHEQAPVSQLAGQGWFTSELEAALIAQRAEAAVHSAKDLPSRLGDGLVIAAHLPRADARDALVSRHGATLATLPERARVATGSPRRIALLRGLRPDLLAVPMRGNVDTRLRRLDAGEVDALLLAAAGLDRLGLSSRIAERLDPASFVPAPAQGVIAVQTLAGSAAQALCARVDDAAARAAVGAERAVLRVLGGGCLLPLGVHAQVDGARLTVHAAFEDEGGRLRHCRVLGSTDAVEALAAQVAAALA